MDTAAPEVNKAMYTMKKKLDVLQTDDLQSQACFYSRAWMAGGNQEMGTHTPPFGKEASLGLKPVHNSLQL